MNIPTTLPFFNSIEKQATRRDSSPALIYSPRTQLPPFQIQRPHVADTWIQDIYLVDCNGEEIDISDYFNTSTELIAGYDNGPGLYQNMNTLTVNDNTVDIDSAIKTTTGSGAAGFRTTTAYAAADEERFYLEIYLILNSGVAPKVYLSKSSDPTVLISNEVLLVSGVNKIILTATSADTVQLLFYNATGAETDFEAMVSLKRAIRPTVYEFTDVDYIQYNGISLIQNKALQFIHSTDTKGYDVVPFNGGTSTPIYYYNNKTYQVWMQRVTTGYDSRAMIWAYDHETSVDGANYDLKSVSEVTGDTDHHPRPSVIVADDGHILVAQEFPRIPLGNHNDAITIKRSDNSEDETSWVNAKAETAGYWTFIGGWQGQSPRLAYPHFHKDHSGNIYVICRRYDGSDGRYDRIYKSTDHGVSWDSGHDIVDGSAGIWMYPIAILSGTSDTLRFAIWKLIDGTSTYDKVFYLESDDGGITWHDISNSFSKDTVASGAITLAELENGTYDFTVVTKADVGKLGVTVKTGTINETGNPFILTIDWDAGFTNTDYRMFYWDGNSWDHSIIKGSMLYNTNPVLIHMSGTIFHCYLEETANQMTLYETINLTSWAKIRDVKTTAGLTANTFVYSQYTNNYKDADYWMFIGVYGTDADYSDIFVETYRSDTEDLLPKGTYYLKLTDGVNEWYSEWFNIQDVYENLISSLVNVSYSTFISSGTKIINAINLAGTDVANTGTFDVANDEVITVILFLTLNSGAVPQIRLLNSSGTTLRSSSIELAEGVNEIELTANAADTVKLQIVTFAPANFSTSDIWVQRKYSPRFVKLQFTNDKDLHGKRKDDQTILYQKGFTQECWLQTILNTPGSNRIDVGQEKDGVFIAEKITTQYKYRIIDYLNRSLFEGLIRLPQHKTITIIDEVGNKYTPDIGNVQVSAEWGTFDTGDVLIEWNDGSFVWVDNAEDIT